MHGEISRAHKGRWAVLASVSLMFSMTILSVSIVNVAMSDIRGSLDAGLSELQWVTTAYLMAFASCLLASGIISDRLGPRLVFVTGATIFIASSLACALATNVLWLVSARVAQGLGAALSVATSLTLIKQSFPEPTRQAKAISVWVGWSSFSLAAGVYLGGRLVSSFGWPSIFIINLPAGAAALLLCLAVRPDHDPIPLRRRLKSTLFGMEALDLPGLALSIVILGSLTMASINFGQNGFWSSNVLGPLLSFPLAVAAFIMVERRSRFPLVPLGILRDDDLWRGCANGIIVSFAYYGLLFFLGAYFQFHLHYDPAATGAAFLPLTAATVIGNFVGGALTVRSGPKPTMLFGSAMAAAASLCAIAVPLGGDWNLAFNLLLLLISLGVSTSVPAITFITVRGASFNRTGMFSGMLNASRQIGGVLGIGVFGSIANMHHDRLESAMPAVMIVSALAFLANVIISAGIPSQPLQSPKP